MHKQDISATEEAFDSIFYKSNVQLLDIVIWAAQWGKARLVAGKPNIMQFHVGCAERYKHRSRNDQLVRVEGDASLQ